MFLFGNLIHAVAVLLSYVLTIYIWVIIIRALISWVNPDPYNPIVQILHRVTEPVLAPVRRRLPDFGGLDISPIVVLLIIFFLQSFLVASLMDLARLLR
ncbi:MAG: YggT family protein [Candidatus Tectomicrobia bacterium]|uniref:YggT family protein n=1 Tax=Tectimicrobiota bacterium TaxID=2528274 RepID=A0A932HYA7_UNCTE|nr:YggT family protein [Candidatus Tectomicrobia bacterium]